MVIQLLLALMVIRVGDHDAQFSFTGFLAGGDSYVGVDPTTRSSVFEYDRPHGTIFPLARGLHGALPFGQKWIRLTVDYLRASVPGAGMIPEVTASSWTWVENRLSPPVLSIDKKTSTQVQDEAETSGIIPEV